MFANNCFSRITLSIIALAAAFTLTGCDSRSNQQATPGRVAIVDMDQVAQATGFTQRLTGLLQRAEQEEQARLQALQQELGIVPNAPIPTDAEAAQKMAQSQMRMRDAVEQAQQRFDMIRYGELEQFRNMIRPVAERVAHAHGFSIVMEMRDGMLSVASEVDITQDIIAELPRQSAAAPSSPGMGGPGAGQFPGMPPQGGSLPRELLQQPPQAPAENAPANQTPATQP